MFLSVSHVVMRIMIRVQEARTRGRKIATEVESAQLGAVQLQPRSNRHERF